MLIWTLKFDKKKAAFWVIMAALVIIGIVLLLGTRSQAAQAGAGTKAAASVKSEKGRVAFLESCGWKVESPAMKEETILIPKSFSPVFEEYNDLQKQQGYDLSRHLGESCLQYCYEVTNYPDSDGKVLVSLYLQDGEIIAADIHSTALNGFMHGLKKQETSG